MKKYQSDEFHITFRSIQTILVPEIEEYFTL